MKAKHIESKWATKSHFLCYKKKNKLKSQLKKKTEVLKNIETNSKLAKRKKIVRKC